MKLIPKDALVAEIERRKNKNQEICTAEGSGAFYEDGFILDIINSSEVKEVDLEKKATQLSQKYFPDEENIWARSNIEAQRCKSACIEMVEWFKEQKGGEQL